MLSDSEREFSQNIKSVIKSIGNEKLTPLESAELWAKIQSSTASKTHAFSWKFYLQIAAAILVVLSFVAIWQYNQNSSTNKLLSFAAQNINKKTFVNKQVSGDSSALHTSHEEDNIITTNDFNTLVVGDGRRSEITLPDGTKVWLNSGSKLIYPTVFDKDNREVYLEGEAYFDVTHNKEQPFHVRGKSMDIKVLGTEFYVGSNIDNKNNYAVLVSGSIAFSGGSWLNKTEKILVPGERINYMPDEKKLLISHVKTAEFKSWKEGYLDIESESLDVIVKSVAKYYNIEISTAAFALENEKFTGRLYLQRNVDDVLAILCEGSPYQYNATERRLELRKN
ncbi:MAG: FecR family protein [Sphingobacteriaceae bacterium]